MFLYFLMCLSFLSLELALDETKFAKLCLIAIINNDP